MKRWRRLWVVGSFEMLIDMAFLIAAYKLGWLNGFRLGVRAHQ